MIMNMTMIIIMSIVMIINIFIVVVAIQQVCLFRC